MPVMSFHGGTSLRIVHNTQRYSEDLDFAVDGDTDYYEFGKWMKRLGGYLKREGYEPNLKEKAPDPSGWRAAVEEKLEAADWGAVREETQRFAIRERDADRLSFDSVRRALRAHSPSTEEPTGRGS